MKKLGLVFGVLLMVLALTPGYPVYGQSQCDVDIKNEIPRYPGGWSGGVAWYNGKIYEVTGSANQAIIKNPVTGVTEGTIPFGSWASEDINDITYDPFRNTFWVKVHEYAYEVAVTGGNWIRRFDVRNQGRGMAFGIWKDPDEENVMWVGDPVQGQVRKTDIRDGSVIKYINTNDIPVRGLVRTGDTLWVVRAGELGMDGALFQIDMSGNTICRWVLPLSRYDHDAGGCELDPDGYLWLHGGKDSAIYHLDIGYVPDSDDSPVIDSGDYDGDSTSDVAVFRPASGLWAIKGVTRAYFGQDGDIPASGDFDGDGTTDISLFRPASGLWAVQGGLRVYFGQDGDIPVPGDYTGDGTVDAAIFRPASGLWAVRGGSRTYFGAQGDIPVPFYPDGRDNPKEIAIFRSASGLWAAPGLPRTYFGTEGDRPVIGTEAEPAIFRAASGLWAVKSLTRFYFGQDGDQPVPGHYTGFLPDNPAIFREASGLWAVRNGFRTYFGQAGDIPVAGLAINPSSALSG
jgi:hypothetical protein